MTEAGSSKRRFPRAAEVLAALLLLAAAGLLLRVGYRPIPSWWRPARQNMALIPPWFMP